MHLALQIVGLLLLTALTAVGPGLLAVRLLRWSPLETLVAATAASWVIIYLIGFGLFVIDAPVGAYWFSSAALGVSTLAQAGRIRRLLRNRAVRLALGSYGLLLAWGFLLLCLVRNYSGGFWTGDWAEQFQRMLVFMHRLPADFWFHGIWQLPARTPMLNVIAAFYCRQVGTSADGRVSFEIFSGVFLIANAWAVLPCCLVYRWWLARRRRRFSIAAAGILLGLLILNPMIAQNITWTWTKLASAGYVLLGVYFYRRAGRGQDRRSGGYAVAGFFFLTAGVMVHLTAAAAALFVGVHYLATRFVSGRRPRWIELGKIVLACGMFAAVWFGWSLQHFGMRRTFRSYADAPVGPVEQHTTAAVRIGHNLLYTLVPHAPSFGRLAAWYGGDSHLVLLRDYTFELYQSCLLVMLGCVGGVVIIGLAVAAVRRGGRVGGGERAFWIGLVAVFLLLAGASTSRLEEFGTAMLCLPVALLGLLLLASELPRLPLAIRLAVVMGSAVDFLVGIVLHFWLQHQLFAFVRQGNELVLRHDGFNDAAAANFYAKTVLGLQFWGDAMAGAAAVLFALMLASGAAAVMGLAWTLLRRERRWDKRRGGGDPRLAATAPLR